MKHKIIQTENYLLVVDDSEIKEGDYTFQEASNLISKYNNAYSKKIIAHLPLNGAPILEGVDLLPPLEDEVEKLAVNNANDFYEKYRTEWEAKKNGFIDGYNTAKEKYKYTEDDIDKAYWAGMKFVGEDKGSYEEFIQSLQQPKMPIEFDCEIDLSKHNGQFRTKYGIKTTTNSQGLTQWVGTYLY